MAFVVPRIESVQYTGTNGATITGPFLRGARLVSDDGTQMVVKFRDDEGRETVNVGDWVLRASGKEFVAVLSDSEYKKLYRELP